MGEDYDTEVVTFAEAEVAVRDDLSDEDAREAAEELLDSLIGDYLHDVEGIEYQGVEADEVKRDN